MIRVSMQYFADKPKDEEPEKQALEGAEGAVQKEQESALPKTQEELDTLIEQRIAREYKKWAKTQAKAVAQPAAAEPSVESRPDPALETAAQELVEARAQLDAYRNGIRADMVEDAVYLAIREVERAGDDLDEESIREALKAVLKRHPDWKQEEKQKSGFKVGADPSDSGKDPSKKALPTGRIIF